MIYFIQSKTGNIKIGYSKNVTKRLDTINYNLDERVKLLATIKGNRTTERDIHNKFLDISIGKEWFKPTIELMTFIEGVTDKKYYTNVEDDSICSMNAHNILINLGHNIKHARLRRGIIQTELAKKAKMSVGTLKAIENGDARIGLSKLVNILCALGLENDLLRVAKDRDREKLITELKIKTNKERARK